MIRSCWSWSSELRELLSSTIFPATTFRSSRARRWRRWRARRGGRQAIHSRADGCGRCLHSAAGAAEGPAVFDADEDVFSISGRGTVATGRVERGVIKVGEEVEIVGLKATTKTVCTGVEMFRKLLDQGEAGDNIGVLLRGTKREDVERGQVLAKPGTITPHTKFSAEAYILTKEEGVPHTPFFTNYRPQFYFRTTDVTGTVRLPEGTEMVMPGDNISMEVQLIQPIAMDEGLRFAIREGGRNRRRRRRRQDHRIARDAAQAVGVERGIAQLVERRSPNRRSRVRILLPLPRRIEDDAEDQRNAVHPGGPPEPPR